MDGGMLLAPATPLTTGPLELRLVMEELSNSADGEMVEDGIIVGGVATLEKPIVLVGVVEEEKVLLGDSAALMLAVLL